MAASGVVEEEGKGDFFVPKRDGWGVTDDLFRVDLPIGTDILGWIYSYCRKRRQEISVISGVGQVNGMTLEQLPSTTNASITHTHKKGCYFISHFIGGIRPPMDDTGEFISSGFRIKAYPCASAESKSTIDQFEGYDSDSTIDTREGCLLPRTGKFMSTGPRASDLSIGGFVTDRLIAASQFYLRFGVYKPDYNKFQRRTDAHGRQTPRPLHLKVQHGLSKLSLGPRTVPCKRKSSLR